MLSRALSWLASYFRLVSVKHFNASVGYGTEKITMKCLEKRREWINVPECVFAPARNVHTQASDNNFVFHPGRTSMIAASRSTPRPMLSTGGIIASNSK